MAIGSRFNVTEFLEEHFSVDDGEMLVSGSEYQIDHEECGDTKKRLWFNVRKQVGTCYKCEEAFDVIKLVQYLENLSYREALKYIAQGEFKAVSLKSLKKRVHEKLTATSASREWDNEEEHLEEMEKPAGFRSCVKLHAKKWPAYITKRIPSEKRVRQYRIGWCKSGFYANRMVIPIFFKGEMVSYVTRAMWKPKCTMGCSKKFLRKHGKHRDECEITTHRPYLYPRESNIGKVLFNYDRALKYKDVVLTEGALDAIHTGPNAMALLGKKVTADQLRLLVQGNFRSITLLLDGDKPGIEAASKAAAALKPFFKVRVVTLPKDVDPDEIPRPRLWKLIDKAPWVGSINEFAARVKAALR